MITPYLNNQAMFDAIERHSEQSTKLVEGLQHPKQKHLMKKLLPQKFITAIEKLLNTDSATATRLLEKIEAEPDQVAKKIYNEFGSATRPISLK